MKKVNSLILLFLSGLIFLYGCGNKAGDVIPENEAGSSKETSAKSPDDAADYSKLANESYGFGYNKNFKKGEIPSIGFYGEMFEDKNAYYTGDTNEKKIYLTFDEGYENGYTEEILDVLKEKNVPAAFFCTGDYLKCNSPIIKRMIDEGHIVGNHTWNHPKMPKVTDDEAAFKKELTEFDEYLYDNYKIKSCYFRYPEGEFSERTLAMIKDMGYHTFFWSIAYKDWERDVTRGANYAVNQITQQIHNGAIILLHAVSSDNAKALPDIIDTLRNEGYEFSSLDNIIN